MRIAIAFLLIGFTTCTSGQTLPPGVRGPGGGMATRSVSNYLALERRIVDPSQDRIDDLVDEGFVARTPVDPDGVTRAEWLGQRMARHAGSRVRSLSVSEVDDLVIVSFLLDEAGSRTTRARTLYIVDAWRRSTGRLLQRYSAAPANLPHALDKPDGRE